MSTSGKTATEFFESLSGFDEIAITKTFGRTVVALSDADQMMFARALVFVDQRRNGQPDQPAYNAALALTIGEVTSYFAEDEDEPVPDEPESESGKGESPLGTRPTSSPPSVC